VTTGDGWFVFRELPAGRYSIAAAAFGHVASEYPPYLVDIVDGVRPPAVSLRLWRHGAISGRVLDERGEPVAGIPVTALRRP
jgi:hypothetical protein